MSDAVDACRQAGRWEADSGQVPYYMAARTAEALGIALRVLVSIALTAADYYRLHAAAEEPGAHLVERRFSQPGPSEKELLTATSARVRVPVSHGSVARCC
ncbi:hypothetical protein [Streptomyces sp. NPDC054794]